MVDVFSREKRSAIMSLVKGRDTKPEWLVRSILHKMGYRYRLHAAALPGKPDIVLPRHRKVIFVHGCFWHGHSCRKGALPKSNKGFWTKKIAKNKERDQRSKRQLGKLGWNVLTIWECLTKDPEKVSYKLKRFMEQ